MILDQKFLNWNKRLNTGRWFKGFWVFWGIYSILAYVAIVFYFLSQTGGLKIVLTAAIAGLFARYVVDEAIMLFYKKPHPYQRLNFKLPTNWVFFSQMDSRQDSFPSQHMSILAAMTAVFFVFNFSLGLIALPILVMTALARVVLGYHDLWDILAGLLVGAASGFFVYFLATLRLFTPR